MERFADVMVDMKYALLDGFSKKETFVSPRGDDRMAWAQLWNNPIFHRDARKIAQSFSCIVRTRSMILHFRTNTTLHPMDSRIFNFTRSGGGTPVSHTL